MSDAFVLQDQTEYKPCMLNNLFIDIKSTHPYNLRILE